MHIIFAIVIVFIFYNCLTISQIINLFFIIIIIITIIIYHYYHQYSNFHHSHLYHYYHPDHNLNHHHLCHYHLYHYYSCTTKKSDYEEIILFRNS